MNSATANLVVEDTDFTSQRLGPAIAMTHTYNADPAVAGMFGNGWTFSYDSTLATDCRGAHVKRGDGQSLAYTTDAYCHEPPPAYPLTLTPPEGTIDTLVDLGGGSFRWDEQRTRWSYRYDTRDEGGTPRIRLVSIRDPSGNTVAITHHADGTIASVRDAAGATTTFAYDAGRRCTQMTVPGGQLASYAYDAAGNLTSTVDLAGVETTYAYDAANYLLEMTTGGTTTSFDYEAYSGNPGASKRLAGVTNARGRRTGFDVDSCSNVSASNPRGGTRGYSNEGGNAIGETDPLGQTATHYYNAQGLLSKSCNAASGCWDLGYDTAGNVVSFKQPSGHTTTLTYDAAGNMTTWTTPVPVARTWTKTWDARHNLTGTLSPLGHTTAMTYDARGQLASFTDPRGGLTTVSHDTFGNVASVTNPLGQVTTLTHDALGRELTSRTNARGSTTQYAHDANGRVTRVTRSDGSFQSFQYDCCAMTGVTDENGHTTTVARNGELQPTLVTDAAGSTTTLDYDESGNLLSVTDALGAETTFAYDAADRPVATTDPSGATTTMAYDAVGNLTALTDPNGNTSTLQHNANGGVFRVYDPLGHYVQWYRRADGNLWWIWNGRDQQVMFAYDADGRVTGKTQVGVTGGTSTYSHDASGNLVQAVDATGTTSFEVDALDRVTRITYPDGLVLAQTFDSVGNIATTTYPGGLVVAYTYDSRNRLTRLAWAGRTIDTTYDGKRNVLTEVRSNGTSTTYARDPNDRLSAVTHARGATTFAEVLAERDAVGRVTHEVCVLPLEPTLSGGAAAGTVDAANQLVTWGGRTRTYDADGNFASASGPGPVTATHDPENQLTSITRGGVTATYRYNGLGQKVAVEQGSGVTRRHFDPLGRLMFESDGSGAVTAVYLYRGRRPVAMRRGATTYFYHYDRVGSTMAMTDDGGSVVQAYAYLPFGEVAGQSGTVPNPFTFSGAHGVIDEGQGLYATRARHYDAGAGRFLERDPIGFAGGVNLYAYAGNDPVNRTDSLGLEYDGDEGLGALMSDGEALTSGARQDVRDAAAWTAEATGVILDNWQPIAFFAFDKAMGFTPYGTVWTGTKIAWLTVVERPAWQNGVSSMTEAFKALTTEAYSPTAALLVDLVFDLAWDRTGALDIPPECQTDWAGRRRVAEAGIDASVRANARGSTYMRWR